MDTNFQTILWVLVGYLVVITSLVPLIGEISDIIGRKRVFNFGFFLFTLGSLLCGLSNSKYHGWDLVIYRVVQGIGASSLFSNSGAIVTDAFIRFNYFGK